LGERSGDKDGKEVRSVSDSVAVVVVVTLDAEWRFWALVRMALAFWL
jgi:hypothetical protein